MNAESSGGASQKKVNIKNTLTSTLLQVEDTSVSTTKVKKLSGNTKRKEHQM
jgi:hypothetical protein